MKWTRRGAFRARSGMEYHFAWRGTGPWVLVLHGFTGDMDAMAPVTRGLEREYRVLGVDLPGHGRSVPIPHPGMDFAQVLLDLRALLDWLGIPRLSCVGYSMGGRVGLGLACQRPSLLRSLHLLGASPGLADRARRRARRQWDADLARYIRHTPPGVFESYWRQVPLFAPAPHPHQDPGNGPAAPARRRGWSDSMAVLGTGAQPSYWDCLDSLPVPVQLIAGERDIKYTQIAESMRARLPRGQLVRIAQAGHRVHLDAPHAVADRIRAFIHAER